MILFFHIDQIECFFCCHVLNCHFHDGHIFYGSIYSCRNFILKIRSIFESQNRSNVAFLIQIFHELYFSKCDNAPEICCEFFGHNLILIDDTKGRLLIIFYGINFVAGLCRVEVDTIFFVDIADGNSVRIPVIPQKR